MDERLSRWGIGPRITSSAMAYAIVAGSFSLAFPGICVLQWLSHPVVIWLAAILTATGTIIWLAGVVSAMKAYNSDRLVTSGVFGLVRHPIYSAWIVLLIPGLTLLSRSWPLLLTPLVAYAVFKRLIHREDEYLAKRFGKEYLEYRHRVNEVIPIPAFWRE